jgi:hypothetical protein
MRAELALIAAGFGKLPTLAGNGYKVAMVNAAGNAMIASAALQQLALTLSTIDSTPIGATTRAAGNFTTLSANGAVNLGSAVTIAGGTINNTTIGGTTPAAAAFTTASASSGFTGNLTGDVTGNLTGNVTTSTGTSTFNNVTINGALDMNAGTANGVAYLNGSKVLTTGSALTFDGTNLTASGYVGAGTYLNVSANAGYINFSGNGTASAPAGLSYGSFLNSGVGLVNFSAASQAFWANSSEQMRLTSTGLGIGTSSPGAKLHVVGNSYFQSGTLFTDAVTAYSGTTLALSAGSTAMTFTVNAAERMRLDSSGLLTVGNTSPAGSSQITAYGASNGQIAVQNSTNWSRLLQNANNLYIDNGVGGSTGNTIFRGSSSTIELMRLDSSGNLGIGTSSPSSKLDVSVADAGTASKWIATSGRLRLRPYADATNGAVFESTNTAENAYLPLSLFGSSVRLGNGAQVIIDSSGNLGLGVTPNAWVGAKAIRVSNVGNFYADGVNFNYTAGVTMNAYQTGASTWAYSLSQPASRYEQVNGLHVWHTAPSGTAGDAITFTQAMTLDASGNLGVGITSPVTKFQVQGSEGEVARIGSGSVAFSLGVGHTGNGTGYINLFPTSSPTTSPTSLAFQMGGTERARIDSSGNLLVGTTSSSARLYVVGPGGSGYANGLAWISSNAASDTTYTAMSIQKYDNDTTTSQKFVTFLINQGAAASGYITANGANAATFTSSSDARLKENITALPNQLSNICALKPSEFDFKDGSGHQVGFIAQEMQEVYPDCVSPDENEMLMISGWSKTEARLVKAIQELKADLDATKAELAALKGA